MEQISEDHLYRAFMAKDSRFDGRFFVGITSTHIYCRPVCKAKRAKQKNCRFYTTAAEAEAAGFRPCLLCRPELAPEAALMNPNDHLLAKAVNMIEEHCGNISSLKEIAEKLGYSDRHLRRVFNEEYHVSPIQYLQTCRLLLAKNLLTDTNLPVLDVAMTAGFGSLRRFNSLFKKQYNLTPTDLRKRNGTGNKEEGQITLGLGYHPPYRWQEILDFFEMRAIKGIEVIQEGHYLRTVHVKSIQGADYYGWIKVRPDEEKSVLKVTVSESLLPVLSQVLKKVRQLFDLYCDPEIVYETMKNMDNFLIGSRIPGCFDPFEMSVRAILGQQITVKGASTLAARVVEKYGKPIETPIDGLTHVFPAPADIIDLVDTLEEQFGKLGVIRTRTKTILALAEALENNELTLEFPADPEEEMKQLVKISGIGKWTAQYIAMRALNWTDAFLETDVGIKKALAPMNQKEMLDWANQWRPWRSYAIVALWNSLKKKED